MVEALQKIKNVIERSAVKPYFVFAVCFAAFIFHCLAWDLVGILSFAVIGGLFFVWLDDVRPAFTLVFTAVFIVSTQNSFGYGDRSDYYLTAPVLPLIIAAFIYVVSCMAVRCVKRKYNFLTAKSFMPILILSVSMILSGVGNVNENKFFESVLYALTAVFSYLGIYLLFSGVIDSTDWIFEYFSTLFTAICILIAAEICFVYILNVLPPFEFLPDNWKACMTGGDFVGWKERIITGWGVSNIAGELVIMLLPFIFYKMLKTKKIVVYELIALFTFMAAVLTLSRNAVLFGVILLVALSIFALKKLNGFQRKTFIKTMCAFFAVVFVALIMLAVVSSFVDIFKNFFDLLTLFSLNGRSTLWETAIEYFKQSPIFGGGYAKVLYGGTSTTVFYQVLFHNFVFQAVGSGGIVGISALVVFMARLIKVFFFNKYENKFFTVCFVLAFAGMSCFDIIYFVPYSVMFLIAVIVIAEKTSMLGHSEEKIRGGNILDKRLG